jgi:mono/diheme cytochrome c family protein
MMDGRFPGRRRVAGAILALLVVSAGCDAPIAHFKLNLPYIHKWELENGESIPPQRLQKIADAMSALMGTPDDPVLVDHPEILISELLSDERLEMAAGPVGSDQQGRARGLFRQHCVHCHGITGDGAGPTAAFLNPYPRDFRRGIFKFKSTPKSVKPTRADLRRTLVEGIPGTAMPSFKLLTESELNALIDYVQYLAIRGEVERGLIEEAADLMEDEQMDLSAENLLLNRLQPVVASWKMAESQVTPISPPPYFSPDFDLAASIERGRQLYYGTVANCAQCHGDTQLGDGQQTDYDDWSKEFYPWNDPSDPEERDKMMAKYVALGGLPPRNAIPRNLRSGVYRGGRRPADIYWRIHNGIDGTPMPAASLRPEGAGAEVPGLTQDDLWDLVNFVLHLPYESLSRPEHADAVFQRERL